MIHDVAISLFNRTREVRFKLDLDLTRRVIAMRMRICRAVVFLNRKCVNSLRQFSDSATRRWMEAPTSGFSLC